MIDVLRRMHYRDLFRMYKPMDERKSLTKGQFRVMRIIALIIFTLLILISYSSYGMQVFPEVHKSGSLYNTTEFPADDRSTLIKTGYANEHC